MQLEISGSHTIQSDILLNYHPTFCFWWFGSNLWSFIKHFLQHLHIHTYTNNTRHLHCGAIQFILFSLMNFLCNAIEGISFKHNLDFVWMCHDLSFSVYFWVCFRQCTEIHCVLYTMKFIILFFYMQNKYFISGELNILNLCIIHS